MTVEVISDLYCVGCGTEAVVFPDGTIGCPECDGEGAGDGS